MSGSVGVPWPASLALARDAGFAAIDIVLPDIAGLAAPVVVEQLAAAGLQAGPASLPVEFRRGEDEFARDLAALPALAAVAGEIGVTTMFRSIPPATDTPFAELLATLRRRIAACAAVLGEHGIGFAIEVIGPLHRRREGAHEFIWRLGEAASFCGADVGLLVDAWHWHHARETVDDIVAVGPLIRHVHVADAEDLAPELIRDEQRVLPGEGVVDFAAFRHALATVGYSGFVSPEIRGYRCAADPLQCARAALRATRACLEPA